MVQELERVLVVLTVVILSLACGAGGSGESDAASGGADVASVKTTSGVLGSSDRGGSTMSEASAAETERPCEEEDIACRCETFALAFAGSDPALYGPEALAALAGEYGKPDDNLRTWNIEPHCDGEALGAIPLWADVAPLQLAPDADGSFKDNWGGSWSFALDDQGKATRVSYAPEQGEAEELQRLGDPRSFG